MKVELAVGEALVVTFKDTDGEVTVAYADKDVSILCGCRPDVARLLQALGGILVHADMPDTKGHECVVYHEPVGILVGGVKDKNKYKEVTIPPQGGEDIRDMDPLDPLSGPDDKPCETCSTFPRGTARNDWRKGTKCGACGAWALKVL